jgi:hypothetical protein
MTVADLREYSSFNAEFLAAVQTARKAGTSVGDIAAGWKVPDRFKGYAEPQPARLKSNIEVILGELK